MGVEDEDTFSSLNLKCQSSENGKIQQMHNYHLTSKLCRGFQGSGQGGNQHAADTLVCCFHE